MCFQPNGLRFLLVGGHGLCLGAGRYEARPEATQFPAQAVLGGDSILFFPAFQFFLKELRIQLLALLYIQISR